VLPAEGKSVADMPLEAVIEASDRAFAESGEGLK
jgi:hypothetical protein